MRSSLLLLCAALASAQKMCPLPPKEGAAAAAAAPMITANPPGAMYAATLPKDGKATGSVTLSSADMGVKMEITLNLPKEGAPFMYHIHAKPVPAVCLYAVLLRV
jgi:Cu/Zn superoxide dismutase